MIVNAPAPVDSLAELTAEQVAAAVDVLARRGCAPTPAARLPCT